MNRINIGIAGLGVVGSSVIEHLENSNINSKSNDNIKINITGICSKNKNKKRSFLIDKYNWFDDPIKMLNKNNLNIYIELMGYEKSISYESIKFSLKNKINVITANKALIANHGNELFNIADTNNVKLLFEASVAGGIPIIKIIKESLFVNNITKISGILNGTTNYILSKMTSENISFDQAFLDAKNKGYVESNPNLDIDGIDSAHKISILSSLCFKMRFVEFSSIYREGISNISKIDIEYAKQLNFIIKLLSVAELHKNKIIQYVKPIMIDKSSQLSRVNDVLNGIQITSEKLGKIFFEGAGAGGDPTASSIISDIYNIYSQSKIPSMGFEFNSFKSIKTLPQDNQISSFYVRLLAQDKPGVLAEITSILKDNSISIEKLIQNPQSDSKENFVPLVFTTHETYFKNIELSIKKINNLESIKIKPVVMQIDRF